MRFWGSQNGHNSSRADALNMMYYFHKKSSHFKKIYIRQDACTVYTEVFCFTEMQYQLLKHIHLSIKTLGETGVSREKFQFLDHKSVIT